MAVRRPRASGTTRQPPLRRNRVKRALGLTLDEKQSYRNYLWRAEESPEACLWDSQPSSPIRRTSFREAARVRLSEGEERELIRRAKAGDGGARDLLWEAFFVFALAECRKQARLTKLAADIAEGEAAFAIPEAIRRFDLRRHVRFSTYLAHRLRGAITAAAREELRSSIFDTAQHRPAMAEEPAEWSEGRSRYCSLLESRRYREDRAQRPGLD